MKSLLKLFYDNRSVMSAETEHIAQGGAYGSLLGHIECQVQVLGERRVNVVGGMVDGGRNNAILDSLDAENGLKGTGCAEQMAGH